ncbi:GDSL-type esterase/lipase family protein [Kineococcus sp. GCM10028916]|uniref:GDSL-type esterase/lipase family protein n=1 Tax=unclassified Kineococcus TaxID=2621656 RepID=UPI002E1ECB41
MNGRYDVRVCLVGDEFVTGVGDPRALGWVGRVSARTPRDDRDITLFPLGVPGETTTDLNNRWREETSRRFVGGDEHRLVVGLGHADLDAGTTLARSRLNLANVLDECEARGLPTLVVGPTPVSDAERNERIGDLADAFADVCARRRISYVDTFSPLAEHEDWYADLAASDGIHPGQAGYGLLAWLVLHSGWYDWLGVPQP